MTTSTIKPKITFVRGDFNACSYYRMILPGKALSEKGYEVNTNPTYDDFASSDILVFQRQYKEMALKEIAEWKKKGKKIIIDYDDNFLSLESHNPAKQFYTEKALEIFKETMSIADAVTVSVKPLVNAYNKINGSVFVLPNSVDEYALSFSKKLPGRPIVGWQGGPSHLEDLKIIKSVINEIQKKYSFDFILAGYEPGNIFKKSIYRKLIPFSEELLHHHLFQDFYIGLCPLTDSEFNECKSDIKFLEYSTMEIPTIASKRTAYESIENGSTGFLARNLADWKKYIGDLLTDESKRNEIGSNAKKYVLESRTIQKNIYKWEELLNNI